MGYAVSCAMRSVSPRLIERKPTTLASLRSQLRSFSPCVTPTLRRSTAESHTRIRRDKIRSGIPGDRRRAQTDWISAGRQSTDSPAQLAHRALRLPLRPKSGLRGALRLHRRDREGRYVRWRPMGLRDPCREIVVEHLVFASLQGDFICRSDRRTERRLAPNYGVLTPRTPPSTVLGQVARCPATRKTEYQASAIAAPHRRSAF